MSLKAINHEIKAMLERHADYKGQIDALVAKKIQSLVSKNTYFKTTVAPLLHLISDTTSQLTVSFTHDSVTLSNPSTTIIFAGKHFADQSSEEIAFRQELLVLKDSFYALIKDCQEKYPNEKNHPAALLNLSQKYTPSEFNALNPSEKDRLYFYTYLLDTPKKDKPHYGEDAFHNQNGCQTTDDVRQEAAAQHLLEQLVSLHAAEDPTANDLYKNLPAHWKSEIENFSQNRPEAIFLYQLKRQSKFHNQRLEKQIETLKQGHEAATTQLQQTHTTEVEQQKNAHAQELKKKEQEITDLQAHQASTLQQPLPESDKPKDEPPLEVPTPIEIETPKPIAELPAPTTPQPLISDAQIDRLAAAIPQKQGHSTTRLVVTAMAMLLVGFWLRYGLGLLADGYLSPITYAV